ncbi:IS5/IS1182 family transposase [Belnapia moabensis]|uniref:IS5/IS1182 family transposase n=1 Tax=Belnapia moabensis TaxID=365533 RepID=UPI000694E0AA|nr:IS5/IS1182 family transposase [Belnapia moabensis]
MTARRRKARKRGLYALDASGYDEGKKIVGCKRHLVTDTIGMLLTVIVHPANVQHRNGAEPLLRQARRLFPFVERLIGDAGYQEPKMAAAVARTGTWKGKIVRSCDRHRFVVLPKCWIVERTIGWISRNGRLASNFERLCRIAAAFIRIAMIRIMLRRLAGKP